MGTRTGVKKTQKTKTHMERYSTSLILKDVHLPNRQRRRMPDLASAEKIHIFFIPLKGL